MSNKFIGKRLFQSANKPRMFALEPRLLYDGAAATTVSDASKSSQAAPVDASAKSVANADAPKASNVPTAIDPTKAQAVNTAPTDTSVLSATSNRNELVVVDGALPNIQTLINDISASSPASTVLILDPSNTSASEVSQLTTYLQNHSNQFDAIHILSHGGTGWIELGNQTLELGIPSENSDLWAGVKSSLHSGGDLLLYGCDIGSDVQGQADVQRLAEYTGAQVAVSSDVTGVDGNWTLEYQTGAIHTKTIQAADWANDLSALTISTPIVVAGTSEVIWTLNGTASSAVSLSLLDGTSTVASVITPYGGGNLLEYSADGGATWNAYSASSSVAIGADGSLLVKAQLNNSANLSGSGLVQLDASQLQAGSVYDIYGISSSNIKLVIGAPTLDSTASANLVQGGNFDALTPLLYWIKDPDSNNVPQNLNWKSMTQAQKDTVQQQLLQYWSASGGGINTYASTGDLGHNNQNGSGLYFGNSADWTATIGGSDASNPASSLWNFYYGTPSGTQSLSDAQGVSAVSNVIFNPPPPVDYFDGGNNTSPVKITQNLATTSGQTYRLQFTIHGEAYGAKADVSAIDIGGQRVYIKDTTASSTYTIQFVASSASTSLSFMSWGHLTGATEMVLDSATVNKATVDSLGALSVIPSSHSALTVNNVTVNEGSPYEVMKVTGNSGQYMQLSTTNGTAVGGTTTPTDGSVDYSTNLQYCNGTSWVNYTPGSYVQIPAGSTSLLVRTAIVNDTANEGAQTYNLVATNTGGDVATGTETIVDDGTGSIFSSSNTTGAPDKTLASSAVVNPSSLSPGEVIADDDRPLSVNNVTVNEGSPYEVFTVTGAVNQYVQLSTTNGTAVGGTTTPTDGSVDYSTNLQYFDGTNWQSYTPGTFVKIPNGGTNLLVRTAIVNDTVYEGAQTYNLVATNTGGTATPNTQGIGTIIDNGTGSIFSANNNTGTPDLTGETSAVAIPGSQTSGTVPLDTAGQVILNDDRPLSVNNVTVNEGSPYEVFKVSGATGQYVQLATTNGTAVGGTTTPTDGSVDYSTNLQYYNGTSWVNYTPGSFVQIPTGSTTLLVRTTIVNDTVYEGAQTYNLVATNTGGTSTPNTQGIGTIVDDGTGSLFSASNTSGNADALGSQSDLPASLNNDIPTLSISNTSVVESTSPNPIVTLSLSNPSAFPITFTPSFDTTGFAGASRLQSSLQYFNGTSWVSAAGGVTIAPGQTSVDLRSSILPDSVQELPSSYQVKTGTVTVGSGGSAVTLASVAGTVTVYDAPTMSISSVAVNEASPYAVVQVSLSSPATSDITFTPSLASVAGSGTAGVDTGTQIQYFNGTSWVSAANGAVIPNGASSVLLRTAIVNDTLNEPPENVSITTGAITSGTVLNPTGVTGAITIYDQGTNSTAANNSIFSASNNTVIPDNLTPTNQAVVDPTHIPNGQVLLDDDRPLSVNNVTVNEGSPYEVFTVTGAVNQYVQLSTTNGTAVGGTTTPTDGSVDYSTNLQYFDGTNWQSYTPGTFVKIPNGGTNLLVRTAIVNDTVYEGAQTYNLVATNTGGTATPNTQGIGTIIDNGTGSIFSANNNTGTPDLTGETSAVAIPGSQTSGTVPLDTAGQVILNDDRPLSVNNVTVNEGSPYEVFKVSGATGQYVQLATTNGTAVGGTTTPTDGSVDYSTNLQYYNGTSWVNYTPGSFVQIPTGSTTLLVRTTIVNDTVYEGAQTYNLVATNTGGTSTPNTQGIGTIVDDGTGSVFNANNNTGTPDLIGLSASEVNPANLPVGQTILDDDRPVTISNVTSTEVIDKYAVFNIQGGINQYVTLSTADVTANAGSDFSRQIQYFNGASWVDYTPNSLVRLSAQGNLQARVGIVADGIWEPTETYTMRVTVNGSQATAQGVGTIIDNTMPILPRPGTQSSNPGGYPYWHHWEEHPIEMGHYEFNAVVLDFNGPYGGINQFRPPMADTTGRREHLDYSNFTPYTPFDRVGDELRSAQHVIDDGLSVANPNDFGLRNVLPPPDAKADSNGKVSYQLPPTTFIGGKGDVRLTAVQKDGSPLPDWVKFNPVTGEINASIPRGVKEPLELRIIATDAKGAQAQANLRIKPEVTTKTGFVGKSSLSSQLKLALMQSV